MLKKKRIPNEFELSSQLYFKDISKYNALSLDEEMSLWKKYKTNNDLAARDKLIHSNLKFVANVAKGFQGLGLSYSDLIAEGNIGLLKSFEKFDYKRGYKTISYSVWWIRQAILEALKERTGIEGEELPNEYEKQTYYDDDEIRPESTIPYYFIDEQKKYEDEQKENEIEEILSEITKTLSAKEKNILAKYYGLGGIKQLTLEEIGSEYNLTKERIRQILVKIFKKVRAEALELNVLNYFKS
jgi:RNA polymerase primary sigma factor